MPLTMRQHGASLHQPAFCELLPIRDYLDNLIVRSNGALVAGYDLGGINSYYHSDETRNQTKYSLEALVRSLTERSMRMQVRFEVVEGLRELPAQYKSQLRSDNPVVQSLDRVRLAAWKQKDRAGFYLTPMLRTYFYWDARIHHEGAEKGGGGKLDKVTGGRNISAAKCIQRMRREHDDLVGEFESILKGVEQTLKATGMAVRRLTDEEMFLELKRAMNPLFQDEIAYRRPDLTIDYRSAREQATNTHIEDDQQTYIKIGGLLYAFLSLKDLPDATFPGILRELLGLDFPLVINTEVSIPDQAERLKFFKGRLRRMTAAQRDSKGGFKVNVDARVAEGQLMQTLQDLISSSLKSARVSVVIAVRTSVPIQSRRDLEEQERVLADRRQRALHAIMRMNGARGLPEDLAKRRLYINGLPGMTGENKREHDCFTLHAADLLMVESPWKGTPNSPLILLETPYRQLVPFSPFDAGLSDANVLITAKSGGGKTFMAQMFLTMMARLNPLISILERGNSYRPLVELMGGRCIDVDLEGAETLNAWDLPSGSTVPSNDKLAFLKNLTRHMIGMNSPAADTSILDNLLTDAIVATYQRCRTREDRPVPTFNDLRQELETWRDESEVERIRDEAQLAAVKLREWTGDKVYARLFDRPTTIRTDENWLFFNVEGLTSDPKLESSMSMIIANSMSERASGRSGQANITVLDECWSLLDSAVLAPQVEQLFRTGRKRGVLRQMGVDEIYLGKTQKFLTVVSNLETGEPLWFGRDRKQETLDEFFRTELSGLQRGRITAACVDMWEPFTASILSWAPECRIVYDKFHVMQHAGKAVDEVRRAEFFRKGGRMRGLVKGKRWLLLSRWVNLDSKKRQLLNELFRLNRRMMKAYLLKESLDRLWTYRYEGAAQRYLNQWIDQLRWQRLEPFKKLAEMLLSHLEGILNYCRVPVRFGVVEAVNGNIKALLRRGRGYKNLRYLLLKAQRLAALKTEFLVLRKAA